MAKRKARASTAQKRPPSEPKDSTVRVAFHRLSDLLDCATERDGKKVPIFAFSTAVSSASGSSVRHLFVMRLSVPLTFGGSQVIPGVWVNLSVLGETPTDEPDDSVMKELADRRVFFNIVCADLERRGFTVIRGVFDGDAAVPGHFDLEIEIPDEETSDEDIEGEEKTTEVTDDEGGSAKDSERVGKITLSEISDGEDEDESDPEEEKAERERLRDEILADQRESKLEEPEAEEEGEGSEDSTGGREQPDSEDDPRPPGAGE